MALFDTAKTGCFLDAIIHSTETRRGDETKVVVLTLRVDPFDVKLALALDDRVRNTLFKMSTGVAQEHLRRVEFALGVPRQNLNIFATTDTAKASIMITQVAIKGVYAKVDKDANHYSLVLKASFGPAGKNELEFVEAWRNTQKWITFEEAEPSLDFDEESDADEAPPVKMERPKPMWDDDPAPAAVSTAQEAMDAVADDHAREVGSVPAKPRGTKDKRTRHNPETERANQVKAGNNGAAH